MLMTDQLPTTTGAVAARRRRIASLAVAASALAIMAMNPALAGCNSGDIGQSATLSSSSCRANVAPDGALAVGDSFTRASDVNATA
jgi:hypothetical protein